MAIGIPPSTYWWGDFSEVRAYIKAYEIKAREINSLADTQAWLNGLYVYHALSVTLPKLFKNTGGKYPQKPLIADKILSDSGKSDEPLSGARLERAQKNFEAQFLAMANAANRSRESRQRK